MASLFSLPNVNIQYVWQRRKWNKDGRGTISTRVWSLCANTRYTEDFKGEKGMKASTSTLYLIRSHTTRHTYIYNIYFSTHSFFQHSMLNWKLIFTHIICQTSHWRRVECRTYIALSLLHISPYYNYTRAVWFKGFFWLYKWLNHSWRYLVPPLPSFLYHHPLVSVDQVWPTGGGAKRWG